MAALIRWEDCCTLGVRFHVYKNRITPKKEAAFRRKDHPDPAVATTMPPRAGPAARATLNPAEFSATADAWCWGETTSGVIACQAGSFITAPTPIRDVNRSSAHEIGSASVCRRDYVSGDKV